MNVAYRHRYEVFAGEGRMWWLPRSWKGDGSLPVVLAGHGHNSSPVGPYCSVPPPGYGWPSWATYLRLGLAIVMIDAGGGKTWNADVALGHMEAARLFSVNELGASGQVHLSGFSMGGCLALTYAAENPASALSVSAVCAPLSIDRAHTDNMNGYATAELEDVYGGLAGFQAALPERDNVWQAQQGAYANAPALITHAASVDPVTHADDAATFAGAAGCTVVEHPEWGHNPQCVDVDQLYEFTRGLTP